MLKCMLKSKRICWNICRNLRWNIYWRNSNLRLFTKMYLGHNCFFVLEKFAKDTLRQSLFGSLSEIPFFAVRHQYIATRLAFSTIYFYTIYFYTIYFGTISFRTIVFCALSQYITAGFFPFFEQSRGLFWLCKSLLQVLYKFFLM